MTFQVVTADTRTNKAVIEYWYDNTNAPLQLFTWERKYLKGYRGLYLKSEELSDNDTLKPLVMAPLNETETGFMWFYE